MALTLLNLNQPTAQQLSEKDIEAMVAIQQKRAQGQALTDADKQTLGHFAEMVVDSLEIPGNGALQRTLKRFLMNGEISPKEQDQLRNALGEIPDIKENPKLVAHLKMLRAKGTATDEEIAMIPKLTGKLSIHEDDAIFACLASLAIGRGISEPAAQGLQTWMDRARIDREKYGNKQGTLGGFKRVGVMALALAGLTALFLVNPFAALGAAGAFAAQAGVMVGTMFGAVRPATNAIARNNSEKILQYGVND